MYLIVTGTVRPLKGQNAQSEQDTRQASGKQAAGSARHVMTVQACEP
ncbi:hypothetical protein [Paenibacillus sp. HGF7]|nr:hypothetical protein [Paenibacillus sp. HGF7]